MNKSTVEMTDKEINKATIHYGGMPQKESKYTHTYITDSDDFNGPSQITVEQEYQIEVDKLEEEAKAEAALQELKKEEPTIKIGRNEICPCGSGKKFKKCCNGKISNRQPISLMVDHIKKTKP